MKITTLLTFIFLCVQTARSQSFLGEDYDLYKNTQLVIKPFGEGQDPKYGYSNFYTKASGETLPKKLIYKRGKGDAEYATIYDSLINKKFTVTNVVEKGTYIYLELYNDITDVIYYQYTPDGRPGNFPFNLASDIKLTDDYIISGIDSSIDKSANKKTYHSPAKNAVAVTKVITADKTYYTLTFKTIGYLESYDPGEGLTVFFKDGTVLKKGDIKIDNIKGAWNSYASNYEYSYYTTFILSDDELKKVLGTEMTSFRLGSHAIDISFSQKYIRYLTMLMNKF